MNRVKSILQRALGGVSLALVLMLASCQAEPPAPMSVVPEQRHLNWHVLPHQFFLLFGWIQPNLNAFNHFVSPPPPLNIY